MKCILHWPNSYKATLAAQKAKLEQQQHIRMLLKAKEYRIKNHTFDWNQLHSYDFPFIEIPLFDNAIKQTELSSITELKEKQTQIHHLISPVERFGSSAVGYLKVTKMPISINKTPALSSNYAKWLMRSAYRMFDGALTLDVVGPRKKNNKNNYVTPAYSLI